MMTAQQQKQHMGVIALTEVITRLKKAAHIVEYDATGEDERRIEAQIASLQKRLEDVRRSRLASGSAIARHRVDIEKKERLLALCLEDDRVAQAVWMQLLLERDPRKK